MKFGPWRRRVRLSIVGCVVLLTLAGCATIEQAVTARDECHEQGGVFEMWGDNVNGYNWKCDLSDVVEP